MRTAFVLFAGVWGLQRLRSEGVPVKSPQAPAKASKKGAGAPACNKQNATPVPKNYTVIAMQTFNSTIIRTGLDERTNFVYQKLSDATSLIAFAKATVLPEMEAMMQMGGVLKDQVSNAQQMASGLGNVIGDGAAKELQEIHASIKDVENFKLSVEGFLSRLDGITDQVQFVLRPNVEDTRKAFEVVLRELDHPSTVAALKENHRNWFRTTPKGKMDSAFKTANSTLIKTKAVLNFTRTDLQSKTEEDLQNVKMTFKNEFKQAWDGAHALPAKERKNMYDSFNQIIHKMNSMIHGVVAHEKAMNEKYQGLQLAVVSLVEWMNHLKMQIDSFIAED